MNIRSALLLGAAVVFLFAAAFFAYYTLRLLYINLAGEVGSRRNSGMYIGAIAFPIATVMFGWIGLKCLRSRGGNAL
jgi:hypothetical protein